VSEPVTPQTARNRSKGGRKAALFVKQRRARLKGFAAIEAAMAPARALQGSEIHEVQSVADVAARLLRRE